MNGYIVWDKAIQNFWRVNIKFGLKITTTYSGWSPEYVVLILRNGFVPYYIAIYLKTTKLNNPQNKKWGHANLGRYTIHEVCLA